MGPALKSACFSCVRYLADDGLAKLMAYISWTPYVAYLWLGALAHSTRRVPLSAAPRFGRLSSPASPRTRRDMTAVVIGLGGLANACESCLYCILHSLQRFDLIELR